MTNDSLVMKVGEIDDVASKLVKVILSERLLIEECGNLLYQAHNMQVQCHQKRKELFDLDIFILLNESMVNTLSFPNET